MSNKTILGDVGGSEMSKNITYEEWKALPRPDPKKMRLKSEIPKAVLVEVTPRMHAAVKAKPDKLRMIAEDADGNAVIDRPFRPRQRQEQPIVPDGPHSAVGAIKWGRGPWPTGIGNPVWSGDASRGDELVRHKYDIFAVLREDD
jgi:hypothetical protein